MKNCYFIIKKQPNQTWEQWIEKRQKGEEIIIPWNWKFDKARKIMKKYKNNNKCTKKSGTSGFDIFIWK